MKHILHLIADFLLAVICCFVLASLIHSQFVLYGLIRLGIEIDLMTRISSSMEDMLGLFPTYGAVILIALLLGFTIVWLIRKYLFSLSGWLYPLAGAASIAIALLAMQPILNITLLASAREPLGIAMQCLAGFFGGWAFMYQRNSRVS